jgi:hypothetical protein
VRLAQDATAIDGDGVGAMLAVGAMLCDGATADGLGEGIEDGATLGVCDAGGVGAVRGAMHAPARTATITKVPIRDAP